MSHEDVKHEHHEHHKREHLKHEHEDQIPHFTSDKGMDDFVNSPSEKKELIEKEPIELIEKEPIELIEKEPIIQSIGVSTPSPSMAPPPQDSWLSRLWSKIF